MLILRRFMRLISSRFAPARNLCSHVEIPPYFYIYPERSDSYRQLYINDMCVYPDFISEEEENSLYSEIEGDLNRRRYEFDHWDDAIHGYREIDRSSWNPLNKNIIERIRNLAFPSNSNLIPEVHIVDLDAKGWIKPHVDSVRFCGNIICGLSILSDSVMRLSLETDESVQCDVLLRRRSLYIMKDQVRYKFKHAILKDEESFFNGIKIPRSRRISLVSRNDA